MMDSLAPARAWRDQWLGRRDTSTGVADRSLRLLVAFHVGQQAAGARPDAPLALADAWRDAEDDLRIHSK